MLREPTDADVKTLLNETGVVYKDKGGYYSLKCPFHEDNNPSAVIYKDKHLFKCFVCGDAYSFSYLYFKLKGKPWACHDDFSIRQTSVQDTLDAYTRRSFSIAEGKVTSVYDNAKALSYCRSRDVSDDFMRHFNFQATDICKFEGSENQSGSVWCDRLLIPILLNGKPYSLEGRDYTRKQTPKCLYPRGCKTDICFNQDALDKNELLIVCEGIMDIHKIWSSITKNVTCTFGVSLSPCQKEFLCDAKNLILFVDDDEAGHNSVSIFEKFMQNDFKVAVVKGKDPGDATVEELKNAIKNAIIWTDFLIDDVGLFGNTESFSLFGV